MHLCLMKENFTLRGARVICVNCIWPWDEYLSCHFLVWQLNEFSYYRALECLSALIILGSSTFIMTPVGLQPMTALTLPAKAQEGCRHHHGQDHTHLFLRRHACGSGHGSCHALDLGSKQQTLAGVRCSLRVLGPYQAAWEGCFA